LRVDFVKSYVKNILAHGPSYLDTMAKILEGGKIINPLMSQLEGGKIINPLMSQLINFCGKNIIKS